MLMYLWMIAGFFISTWIMQTITVYAGAKSRTFFNIIFGLIGVLVVYTIFNS